MDLCIITLFNATADEMTGHRLRCVLPLPWGVGLCLSNWQEVCLANRLLPKSLLSHLQGR